MKFLDITPIIVDAFGVQHSLTTVRYRISTEEAGVTDTPYLHPLRLAPPTPVRILGWDGRSTSSLMFGIEILEDDNRIVDIPVVE